MKGREKLKAWMAAMVPPMTQAELGRLVEVDHGYLSRIMAGKQLPGLKVAVRIEAVTCGRCAAADWVE